MSSFDTALVGLAETHVNWQHHLPSDTVDTHLRLAFRNSRMMTSSSGLRSKSIFLPGGTLTAALGRWSGRKLDVGRDDIG